MVVERQLGGQEQSGGTLSISLRQWWLGVGRPAFWLKLQRDIF